MLLERIESKVELMLFLKRNEMGTQLEELKEYRSLGEEGDRVGGILSLCLQGQMEQVVPTVISQIKSKG